MRKANYGGLDISLCGLYLSTQYSVLSTEWVLELVVREKRQVCSCAGRGGC